MPGDYGVYSAMLTSKSRQCQEQIWGVRSVERTRCLTGILLYFQLMCGITTRFDALHGLLYPFRQRVVERIFDFEFNVVKVEIEVVG